MDLPCHWGPGGRRARAVGMLGIRPLTRLGGVQLTCLDLSPPIAIFQRKGKILRESHKRTLSLRLTDRLNLRVSPISSGTLLQLWQSCSLQRRAATAWDFMYPEHHLNPTAASTAVLRCTLLHCTPCKKAAGPTHQLGRESDESKPFPLRSPKPTATSRQKQSSERYPGSSN